MRKVKKAFFCQNCGYESVKWIGQCPSCGQWNVFVEELIQKETTNNNQQPKNTRALFSKVTDKGKHAKSTKQLNSQTILDYCSFSSSISPESGFLFTHIFYFI